MTPDEISKYLGENPVKGPAQYKIGDYIGKHKIVDIVGLVDGKPTYASTFICQEEAKNGN